MKTWVPVDLDDQSRALVARMYSAGLVFLVVMLLGAGGYHAIGQGRWSFGDCLYMAVITLSTVGFGETLPGMDQVPLARVWTGALILLGSGTLLYFASTLTAFIVEGDLRGAIRRRTMSRLVDRVHSHVIVCGVGSTGTHIVDELEQSHTPYVVVERDQARIERLVAERGHEVMYVLGDATEDHILEEAGIERAMGLIAALKEDRDNLFVTITARALSDVVRIVAKAVDIENITKLQRAGANSVVAPTRIGGARMASEMVRPSVMQFLDNIARNKDNRRIEELLIKADSPLVGMPLMDARLREACDALVIAVRFVDGQHEYNPGPNLVLRPGMVLIVLVRSGELGMIERYVNEGVEPTRES